MEHPPAFAWANPYAWPRKPLLARNVVATSQPLAAQAGLQMLAAGGNAVDAILATAITLTVVEPISNGIGSDAFAILWDGKQAARPQRLGALARGLDAGPLRRQEGDAAARLGLGHACRAASRPGSSCTRKFGKLPFEKLFEPAIRYGRKGFLVSPTIAGQWAKQVPELKVQPGFAEAFLPDGRAPAAGRALQVPGARRRRWSRSPRRKGEAFYRGELAEKIEAHAKKHGGAMRATDLAAHKSDWVEPLEMDYRGYTLHEIPPNGQGIVALMALGILEHFDLRSHAGRRRRQPAPADRGDEARLRRRAAPTWPTSTT